MTKWLIIKHMTCVHDLHLKPYLTVSRWVYKRRPDQLTDEFPVYNRIQSSNSEKYGLPSSFLTKQEELDNCYSSST